MSAVPKSELRLTDAIPARLTRMSEPTAGAGGLPTTGLVLIGTSSSVRAIAGQIAGLRQSCIPAGCVLVDHFGGRSDDAPLAGILPPRLGHVDDLIALAAQYRFRLVLVSLPRSMQVEQRRIANLLKTLDIPVRWIPTTEDLLSGAVSVGTPARASTADVDPAQLIGRTHSGLDRKAVASVLTGKRVLITGAGGSIGSELCRVVAGFNPEEIILMERAENALFQIDHAIARQFPGIKRRAVLHDVVDEDSTRELLAKLRPHVVFHAAAHKHVPLMEDHPSHAVSNNLFGTKSIADAALFAGAERFVMISSDKAVNPSSVMGATKRMAEMYIQGLASRNATRFSMVRFGNVLASACSVIPIWGQQISEGAPITVTDPRMTRYFMTIPEAATLVVQAAALDQPVGAAPVYVLDMGEPIRIVDLAVRFARLQGLEPQIDITSLPALARESAAALLEDLGEAEAPDAATVSIVFTGARPGEKLHEELAYNAEKLAGTAHPAINQWTAFGARVDTAAVRHMVDEMATLRKPQADKAKVVEAIRRHVPEMKKIGP